MFRQMHSHTLDHHPRGEDMRQVILAALRAVDPAAAVARSLELEGGLLTAGGRSFDLDLYRRVRLVAAGKAGLTMARAAARVLKERLNDGVVIVKKGFLASDPEQYTLPDRLRVFQAGHPVPDERGVAATQEIVALLESSGAEDLVICLLSGGGSALLTAPAPGISLGDLQALTAELLACGANINEINTLRKHLDGVKGGGLARAAAPAHMLVLILSDVVGDPLDVIASGPTVPDQSTFENAMTVVERYRLADKIPESILTRLQAGWRGEIAETPKPGEAFFERVHTLVVGSNRQAAQAALQEARARGMQTLLLTTYLQGEARQAGRMLAAIARQIDASGQPVERPACLVVGGETTVTVRGQGLGGRNLEAGLGAVREMDGLTDMILVTLATDGDDGPTGAAGVVVSGKTLARAGTLGLRPEEFLLDNDSYHFFEPLDDLLVSGPTHTNVNDLAFLFAL